MENPEQSQNKEAENIVEKEISPELVEAIEKGAFSIDDKVNMLLTRAGLKPASEITLTIRTWNEKEDNQHMTEEFIQEDVRIVKELGIPVQIGEVETIDWEVENKKGQHVKYQRQEMCILIGRTQQDLDFLIEAQKSGDSELLGRAYGFPLTAVEVWTERRKKLDFKKLPEKIRKSDAVLFSSPTLSADNWQEEVKQGQRDADYIKSISPFIYREWIDMMKRSRE